MVPWLAELTADPALDAAYAWLCKARIDHPDSADIWDFRRRWAHEKETLRAQLAAGTYRFDLLRRITLDGGEHIDLWSAPDALVLKALTMVLARRLPVSATCTHLKGHGGLKGAVRKVCGALAAHRFVLRTDVKSFYDSIDHDLLMAELSAQVDDPRILNLLRQYLKRVAERGGLFWEFSRGISLGCSLSPLIGAFFLTRLDERISRRGLFYVRYLDDLLVLTARRWKLRAAVRAVNQELDALKLEKHPHKTFIGRIEKGFDFLGYRFSRKGLAVAEKTIANFVERLTRLYEQGRSAQERARRLGAYVRRWVGWVQGGLARGSIDGRDGLNSALARMPATVQSHSR